MERRILYGAALVALGTAIVSSGSLDMLQDTTALTDGAAATEGSSAISTAMEAIAGAAAGLSGLGESLIEDSELMQQSAGTELAELGTLAALLDGIPGILGVFVRQLTGVLVQILTRVL